MHLKSCQNISVVQIRGETCKWLRRVGGKKSTREGQVAVQRVVRGTDGSLKLSLRPCVEDQFPPLGLLTRSIPMGGAGGRWGPRLRVGWQGGGGCITWILRTDTWRVLRRWNLGVDHPAPFPTTCCRIGPAKGGGYQQASSRGGIQIRTQWVVATGSGGGGTR